MLVMDESNSKVDFKLSRFFLLLTAIHYFSACSLGSDAIEPKQLPLGLDWTICANLGGLVANAIVLKLAFSLLMYKLLKHLSGSLYQFHLWMSLNGYHTWKLIHTFTPLVT